MLSINDIVARVDKNLCQLIDGLKTYGIAKSATVDGKIMPYNGETYVGLDDTFKAQAYHRQLSVRSAKQRETGYGDVPYWYMNEYDMALILRYDETSCSDLYVFIQASVPGVIKSSDFKMIQVEVESAILDDERVWKQEYGTTPYALFGSQRLIQVNYTVTTVFDKNCIVIPNCSN